MSTHEEKLIERITTCLEEYGMPKFQDRFPALSVLQIIKDHGYTIIDKPYETNAL